jgi:hypothetical protein
MVTHVCSGFAVNLEGGISLLAVYLYVTFTTKLYLQLLWPFSDLDVLDGQTLPYRRPGRVRRKGRRRS